MLLSAHPVESTNWLILIVEKHDAIERGYHSYRNDDLLDFLFEEAGAGDQSDDYVGFGVISS